jgi:hypothetical protein
LNLVEKGRMAHFAVPAMDGVRPKPRACQGGQGVDPRGRREAALSRHSGAQGIHRWDSDTGSTNNVSLLLVFSEVCYTQSVAKQAGAKLMKQERQRVLLDVREVPANVLTENISWEEPRLRLTAAAV